MVGGAYLAQRMDQAKLEDITAATEQICRLVKAAGGRAWIVGGAVRDRLLGLAQKDIDLEVFGVPAEELERIVGAHFDYDTCGKAFGVLKLHHLSIDVALPRRETKINEGHRGFIIEGDPALPLEEAASRRDFTINAIYFDPLTNEFADPFDGRADLATHTLRHVSPKFCEDPLRVLRGMQFVARFGLKPHESTIQICRKMGIENLPAERLLEEWRKFILKGQAMREGLDFLRATEWVRFFPELARLIDCAQDSQWHPEGDVWNHTGHCLDYFAAHRIGNEHEDLIVGLAVLCHDFGKPATTRYERGRLRSLGHDSAGVKPTLKFLRRLTNDATILAEVPPLVQFHMSPFSFWRSHAGDAAIRRLSAKVKRLDRLIRVARADDAGRPPFPATGEDLDWLSAQAERLRVLDAAPKPILMGRDLITLGLKPAPLFSRIIAECYSAQLNGQVADRESALKFAQDFISRLSAQRPS